MRLLKTALAGSALLAWACGGSSSAGLFDGTSPANVGGASAGGAGGSSPGGTFGAGGGGLSSGGIGAGGFGQGTGGAGTGGVLQTGGGGASMGGTQPVPDAGAGAGGGVNLGCPAGDFTGKLKGPYTSAAGTNDVGASVGFTVGNSGSVTGSFTGPNGAKARLTGQLNCETGRLTVDVQNGTYPLGFVSVAFEGTLEGHYSASESAFVDGTWELTERATPGNGGTGTWTSP